MKKKYMSALSALAVMTLCSVSGSYAWESLNQAALNVYEQEISVRPPDPSDDSGNLNRPDKPDGTEPDDQAPSDPEEGEKPADKPTQTPSDGRSDTDQGQTPSADPDDTKSTDAVQSGESGMTTGDTCQFVFYLVLMLFSFAVAIIAGAFLSVLTIHEIGKRRRQLWEENRQY